MTGYLQLLNSVTNHCINNRQSQIFRHLHSRLNPINNKSNLITFSIQGHLSNDISKFPFYIGIKIITNKIILRIVFPIHRIHLKFYNTHKFIKSNRQKLKKKSIIHSIFFFVYDNRLTWMDKNAKATMPAKNFIFK